MNTNYDEMEAHEYADLFPVIEEDALDDLAEDIKANGLHTPIVTYQGKILDGRNRLKACERVGIELNQDKHFREYDGDTPLSYVISLNIHRRHLNESQRAMIAGKISNMKRGDNQHASIEATSQTDAAKMLNVSRSSVQRVSKIIDKGVPELSNAITKGEISVNQAQKISVLPKEEQKQALEHKQKGAQHSKQEKKRKAVPYANDVRAVLGDINLDPLSNEETNTNVMAEQFFTKDDNSLEQDWNGSVWLHIAHNNGHTSQYAEKLAEEYRNGNCTEAIMLCSNSTSALWFQNLAKTSTAICFPCIENISQNDSFSSQTGKQALFYLGQNGEEFTNVFSKHGIILRCQK